MIETVLHPDVKELLFSEQELLQRTKELGRQISADYADKNPLLVCTLKGAVHFFADLAKSVTVECEYDFAAAESYGDGTQTSGNVRLKKDIETDITGRHVLLIDDIMDSGLTLNYLCEVLRARQPASVKTCVLLDKPERRAVPIDPDYAGFVIPNRFVVGYGLDYRQHYRSLPYIGVLKPEKY